MNRINIAELAKVNGAENLRFFFPASPLRSFGAMFNFTSSDDEEVVVEAKAVERFNRVVADNYKMILQPNDNAYAYEDFYICTFETLCEEYPEEYYVMIGDAIVSVDTSLESV